MFGRNRNALKEEKEKEEDDATNQYRKLGEIEHLVCFLENHFSYTKYTCRLVCYKPFQVAI